MGLTADCCFEYASRPAATSCARLTTTDYVSTAEFSLLRLAVKSDTEHKICLVAQLWFSIEFAVSSSLRKSNNGTYKDEAHGGLSQPASKLIL
jgi:hypothetical protein